MNNDEKLLTSVAKNSKKLGSTATCSVSNPNSGLRSDSGRDMIEKELPGLAISRHNHVF